ncbi:hypothetical protein ACWIG4_30325 [Streptomyces sp. NPDC002248]
MTENQLKTEQLLFALFSPSAEVQQSAIIGLSQIIVNHEARIEHLEEALRRIRHDSGGDR